MTKSLAQDLCTEVTLLCVAGEGGYPHIQMHTDSQDCSKCANRQDLDTLEAQLSTHAKNTKDTLALMKANMDKLLNNTGKGLLFTFCLKVVFNFISHGV